MRIYQRNRDEVNLHNNNITEKKIWTWNIRISWPARPSLPSEPLGRVSADIVYNIIILNRRYIFMYISRALDKFAVSTRRRRRRQNVVRFFSLGEFMDNTAFARMRFRPHGRARYYIILLSLLCATTVVVAAVGNKFGIFPYACTEQSYISYDYIYTLHYIILWYNIYNTQLCIHALLYNIHRRRREHTRRRSLSPPATTHSPPPPYRSRPIEEHRFSAPETPPAKRTPFNCVWNYSGPGR